MAKVTLRLPPSALTSLVPEFPSRPTQSGVVLGGGILGEDKASVLLNLIGYAPEQYHSLVLVVGPPGSGKTTLLRRIEESTGAPLVNVSLDLSRLMLELTERQRILQMPTLLSDAVLSKGPSGLVLLDNTEILFDTAYRQDPLSILQGLSRNLTVVASWAGSIEGQSLIYASPDHQEYRRYPARDLMIVDMQRTG